MTIWGIHHVITTGRPLAPRPLSHTSDTAYKTRHFVNQTRKKCSEKEINKKWKECGEKVWKTFASCIILGRFYTLNTSSFHLFYFSSVFGTFAKARPPPHSAQWTLNYRGPNRWKIGKNFKKKVAWPLSKKKQKITNNIPFLKLFFPKGSDHPQGHFFLL